MSATPYRDALPLVEPGIEFARAILVSSESAIVSVSIRLVMVSTRRKFGTRIFVNVDIESKSVQIYQIHLRPK